MEIEKNIPLPKYNWYNTNNKYEDIAKKMVVGDSVFFEEIDNLFPVSEANKLFNKIKKIYGKGSARTARFHESSNTKKKGIRVWRVK